VKVTRKSFGEFVLVIGGKLSISAVVFLAGILVARFGGVREYGIFSVAMSTILLCDGMIGSPLDMAAVRFSAMHPGELERTRKFEAMAMHLKLLLAAMVFVIGGAVMLSLGQWQSKIVGGSFPVFACALATGSLLLARSVGTGLQIRERFKAYSMVDLLQGMARLTAFLVLGLTHHAKAGLYVIAYGLAGFITAISGFGLLGQRYLLGMWPNKRDAGRMLRYAGFSSGIVALGTITGRGDLLILGFVKGADNVSAYGAASLLAMLVAQFALYTSVLTQPRVLRMAKEGELRRFFAANAAFVFVIGIAAAVLMSPAILGRLISLVFGHGFNETIPILRVLLFGAVVDLLIVPVLMVFCIQTCPKQVFTGEALICMAFLAAAGCAATGRLGASAAVAMAWVAAVARVAKLILYGGLFMARTSPKALAEFESGEALTMSPQPAGTNG
jgi:O-antigen/teichoic acid export membrane protein